MSTISNLSSSVSLAKMQTSFVQYILTPLNAFGLGGLVFDIEGETSIKLRADITDHFLEDNTTVQDNIALHPQRITFKGYAGDVVNQVTAPSNANVQKVAQKLTVLSEYLPELAKQAQQILPNLSEASQRFTSGSLSNLLTSSLATPTLNNIVSIWSIIKNINPGNGRQQKIYIYLKALYEQKILLSLQTPFEFVTNLAIEDITATQPEDSRSMSVFTIVLKKIRVATTQVASFNPGQFQGQSLSQNQPLQQLGNNQGLQVDLSTLPWKVPYAPNQ